MQDKYELTQEENIFLAKKMMVNNIYSNAKIEGCNVTFPETEALYAGVNVGRLTIDEIDTIRNLKRAWQFLIAQGEEEFNLDFICKINEEVARDESLGWGKLRTGKVLIGGTEYVPPIPNQVQVENEIERILTIECITERAIEYMLYGMRSQLFWDGNKRTSIICANKIMIENGKGMLLVKDNNLQEFSRLLSEFYTTGKKETIKKFIFENCIIGIDFE